MKFSLWKQIHFTLSLEFQIFVISRSVFRIPIVITDFDDCKQKHIKNSTQLFLEAEWWGEWTVIKKMQLRAHNYFYIQYFENALHSFRHICWRWIFFISFESHSKSISIQMPLLHSTYKKFSVFFSRAVVVLFQMCHFRYTN